MKKTLSVRPPSPSMLVASMALFVSLGGTGYAAFNLPKNSVGGAQLKKGAITTSKIANGAVTASKINSRGLTVPQALHADSADTAGSATKAANASHANNADFSSNAGHANTADNASNASHANTADNASNASHANTADNATNLGGLPPGAFAGATSWALVGAGGTIDSQSGGISVTASSGSGQYTLNLGRDISKSPILVTLDYGNTAYLPGEVSAAPCGGGPSDIDRTQCAVGNDSNHVFVQTTDPTGHSSSHPFYIVIPG